MKFDVDAGHGPVTGPISVGVGALAATHLGHVAHLTPGWAAATAAAGLIGTHISGRRHHTPRTTLGLRAAAWTALGGWCSWAVAAGPWTPDTLATLGSGIVLFGCGLAGTRHAPNPAGSGADAEQRTAARRSRTAIAAEWEARIGRVCTAAAGLRIVNVEQWPTGGGYTLDAELPTGGATWRSVAQFSDGLAADAKLPEGCGVDVGPGAHRGAVIIDVSTLNRLVQDVPYPDDYSPLTVNGPAAFGVRRDGSVNGPVMRQQSALIVGQRGSGKTNLMNVMLANQCRMVDSLTWVIDLNGGGLALKWLRAWHAAGRPGRPPVDWVADTPDRALEVARALVRVAKARKTGYQDREIAADDDKLPIDADVPEIRVFNDEGAELFSTKARMGNETLKEVAAALVQVLEIARAAGVNETTSGLRGTQDVISDAQILKQSTLRVGMKVADAAELNYFFGWDNTAGPEDAPYPGCALVREGDTQTTPVKVYRIRPSQIRDIVVATAGRRPELDALSRRAAGEAYERRWDGMEHLFGTAPAPVPMPDEEEAAPQPRRRSVTAGWDSEPTVPGAQAAIDQADALRDQVRRAMAESDRHDRDLERRFQEIVEGGGGVWLPRTPGSWPDGPMPTVGVSSDPRWPTVFRIVVDAGPVGVSPDMIADLFRGALPGAVVPSRSAITDWLKGEPQIHQPGGKRTNYIYRADLGE